MGHDVEYDSMGTCVGCGTRFTGSTCSTEEGASPEPGDISVCAQCSTPMVFDEKMQMRSMTDEEVESLPRVVRLEVKRVQKETGEARRRTGVVQ